MTLEGEVEISQDSPGPDDLEIVDPADKAGHTEESRNFLKRFNQNPLGARELATLFDNYSPAEKRACLEYVDGQSESYRIMFYGYMDN